MTQSIEVHPLPGLIGWQNDVFTEVEAVGAVVDGLWVDFNNPQPWPLAADSADFRDFGDRCTLGKLGIFSKDKHKETHS